MTRRSCCLVLMALVVAGCSDGAEPTVAPTVQSTTPPTTVAPTTTAPPPTTTAPTTAPPTTVPPPTAPPTVPPTTPPSDPLTDLAATIERDLNLGEQALIRAGGTPGSQESRALIRSYFDGPAEASLLNFLDDLAAAGNVVRPNAATPSVIALLSEPVVISEEPLRVAVDTCRIDAASVVTPLTSDPSGEVSVVDDSVSRIDAASTLVLIDGIWQLEGGEPLTDRRLGVTTCR